MLGWRTLTKGTCSWTAYSVPHVHDWEHALDCKANTTLHFAERAPTKGAMKFVKESRILQDYRGIALAQSSSSPMSDDPIRLFAGLSQRSPTTKDADSQNATLETLPSLKHDQDVNQQQNSSLALINVEILSVATGRKCTIGGFFKYNEKYFGLTAAHIFLEGNEDAEPEHKSCDNDFAFDEDEEDDLVQQNVDLSSQGMI